MQVVLTRNLFHTCFVIDEKGGNIVEVSRSKFCTRDYFSSMNL